MTPELREFIEVSGVLDSDGSDIGYCTKCKDIRFCHIEYHDYNTLCNACGSETSVISEDRLHTLNDPILEKEIQTKLQYYNNLIKDYKDAKI